MKRLATFRISDGERELLDAYSTATGRTQTDVVRDLIRSLARKLARVQRLRDEQRQQAPEAGAQQ